MDESIGQLCTNLTRAFAEQQDDPVSLVTIIDMYGTQVNTNGERIEKEKYLQCLLQSLLNNIPILEQIGWDLPKILLDFVSNENIEFDKKLSNSIIFTTLMKCFNLIALNANPKEFLLTTSELLSELSMNESSGETEETIQENNDDKDELYVPINVNEFIPDLKLHILFQLLITSVERIDTIYPSRFLGMIVSAISKFTRSNIDYIHDTNFILRRVYEFCANYNKIQENRIIPKDIPNDVLAEESESIFNDQQQLESKLVVNLLTSTLAIGLKSKITQFDLNYFLLLTDTKNQEDIISPEFEDICSKYYLLTLLYNIDLAQEFQEYLDESKTIYETAMDKIVKSEKDDDKIKINQFIYELSYAFSIQKTFNQKTLNVDPYGIVLLSGIYYIEEKKQLLADITIQDAVYLYLRCSSASLYSELYHNKAVESVARYWLWVAITQNSTNSLKSELSKIPSLMVNIFLQLLLLKNCTQQDEKIRTISFTLLSRILCLVSENIAYDFILDTLLFCPYISARCNMIAILKTIMIKTIQTGTDDVDKLSKQVNALQLKKSEPPKLPSRPYILINEDRMAALHSVALLALEEVKKDKTKQIYLTLLLSYMNFFTSLRDKWNKSLLSALHDEVAETFEQDTKDSLPEIGSIQIANNILQEYLESESKLTK